MAARQTISEARKEAENWREAAEMYANSLTRLSTLLKTQFGVSPDGSRDYNALFGYGSADPDFSTLYSFFRRSPMASVIVEKVAKACWRDLPAIQVDGEPVLEGEMRALARAGFFRSLERADILNRVGSYSALLVGVPDGQKLSEPLGKMNPRLLSQAYFQPFGQDGVIFRDYDRDETSARYGLPVTYQLQVVDMGDKSATTIGYSARMANWERVIHLAEGSLDSPVEGRSALLAAYNVLIDILKISGGSGESYYRGARQKIAYEVDSKAGAFDADKFKTDVKAFHDGFQDHIATTGMKPHALGASVSSPRDPFDVAIEQISGLTGIPIRVLTGVGGGQLAGSEDKAAWNSLIQDRRDAECSQHVLRGLQIFEKAGALEIPEDAEVVWPESPATSEKEEAETRKDNASALELVLRAASSVRGDDLKLAEALEAVGFDPGLVEDDIGEE